MRKVATEVSERGGKGIAVRCDYRNDDEVKSVFEQIREKERSLDILVNNAWGGYERIRKRKKYKGYK
jgi:NAD(P)-dependent dehydrogenase (short-subunit alcohol dehydrogenase family)